MEALFRQIAQDIKSRVENANKTVLLWSGGKDSNLILEIIRLEKLEVQIMQFRPDWRKSQKAWIDQQIIEKDLSVISPMPVDRFVVQTGQNIALVDDYLINGQRLPIIRDAVYSEFSCILEISKERCAEVPFPYDLVLTGWKKGETHPILGDFELSQSETVGNAEFYSPLFDLTDEEVFGLCAYLDVALPGHYGSNYTDYEKGDTGNILACSECLKGADEVICPKLQRTIRGHSWDREKVLEQFQERFKR